MHCFTFFNNEFSKGILTVEHQELGEVVELGAPFRGKSPILVRRFRENPPVVESDGRIYEASPGFYNHNKSHRRKGNLERTKMLKDIFWHDPKILLRVNTSIIGDRIAGEVTRVKYKFRNLDEENSRKCGGWDIRCGKPEDWVGTSRAFEDAVGWSDGIIIMHHGDAITVNPQWGEEKDRVVIFDSFGVLHCVKKQDFKKSLLKCGPKLPEELGTKEKPTKPFVVSKDEGSKKEEEEDPSAWPEEVVDYERQHPEEVFEGDCEADSDNSLIEVAECSMSSDGCSEGSQEKPQTESVQ